MVDKLSSFRQALLQAQEISPDLRDEYRSELNALLNCTLTRRSRLFAWAGLLACVAAAAACIWSLVVHFDKLDARVTLPTFAAVFLAFAAWIGLALYRGMFARTSWHAITYQLGGIAVGVFDAVVTFRAMNAPIEPASMLMAILFTMMGFAWATGSHIAISTLETREHLFRLESRMADLSERLDGR
jgi:hypothetical protein